MKLKETKSSTVKLLYQLMYDINLLFKNNNINYWADGGTFLGTIRHNGIIPWYDDIDIGILTKDVKKFLSLESKLKKCGYSITKTWFGYKVFYTNRKLIKDTDYSFPNLDVLTYRLNKDGKYDLSHKEARDIWPKEVWNIKDLFPLKTYKFGSFTITGPADYETYFTKYYGNDWNKIAYREYDHQKEESVDKVKVNLTDSMRKPAKPYDMVKDRPCISSCIVATKETTSPTSWMVKSTKTCAKSGGCYNNFVEKVGVYVINCKIHTSRYEKFMKHSEIAGVKACRMNCVSGKKFSDNLICDMIKNKILSPKAEMTKVEISINMSHYNCWKKLVNSCLDYAIILEDDVELKPDFIQNINKIFQTFVDKNIDFSILHLWNGNWAKTKAKHKKIGSVGAIQIVKETIDYNAGAVAYIMSKEYAKWLMDHFLPIKMPQDILMGLYYKHGNHLSLKMGYSKKDDCYISPVLDLECGGEGGTGSQTTQTYEAPVIKKLKCKIC